MKKRVTQLILVAALFVSGCQIATAQIAPQTSPGGKPNTQPCTTFRVFDGTMYSHKPDLSQHGIEPITMVYAQELWPEKAVTQSLPPREYVHDAIQSSLSRKTSGIIVLDIEQWRLDTEKLQSVNIPKYKALARWAKEANPALQVGYFGMFPLPDYHRGSKSLGALHYKSWQWENARLRDLGSAVDVLFPEAYTPPALKREDWVTYAQSVIEEARAFGKPVYVFLWPQFYDTGHTGEPWHYIPADYWNLQLHTAQRFADGVVIWGGYDPAQRNLERWNDSADWWQVTKSFMHERGACREGTLSTMPNHPKGLQVQ